MVKFYLKALSALSTLLVVGIICVLLFPLWKLYCWIVNLFGTDSMRIKDKNLETPVVFYQHPVTRRMIVFIAMTHIGEKSYYSRVQEIINSLTGYIVLFEGTGKLSPEEESSLSDKERSLKVQIDSMFEAIEEFSKILFLQHQKQGLSYDTSWINTDFTTYKILQELAKENFNFFKPERNVDRLFEDKKYHRLIRWMVNTMFTNFVALALLSAPIRLISRKKRINEKIILDDRNVEAISGISKYIQQGDVISIWGAGHMKGISKWIKENGFLEVRREWIIAYRNRNYNLWKSVRLLALLDQNERTLDQLKERIKDL